MADVSSNGNGNGRRIGGVHFDPTINLGHVMTACVFLASTMAAWYTLNAQVTQNGIELDRVRQTLATKVDKESMGKTEVEFSRRIVETNTLINQTQARIADDVRDMKSMMREGFRDLDTRLDRKADKPGAR